MQGASAYMGARAAAGAQPLTAAGPGRAWLARDRPRSCDHDGSLTIYKLGQPEPALELANGFLAIHAMGSVIGVVDVVVTPQGGQRLSLIDLSGATPVMRQIPGPHSDWVGVFAGADASHWSLGGTYGVLYNGARPDAVGKPRPLNCGAVLSLSGAANGRMAVAEWWHNEDATMLTGAQIYLSRTNSIYDVMSGNTLWSGPPPSAAPRGTLAGGSVVFTEAAHLRIEAYTGEPGGE